MHSAGKRFLMTFKHMQKGHFEAGSLKGFKRWFSYLKRDLKNPTSSGQNFKTESFGHGNNGLCHISKIDVASPRSSDATLISSVSF